METKDKSLKDKFADMCKSLTFNCDNNKCEWVEVYHTDDKDYPFLKAKMLKLIQKFESLSDNEKVEFWNLDIQNDIWDII